ncbi:TPA: hypothetical protein ACLBZX_005635 [Bacillus cereus]|uniref:hypothetical protein n=1 Tax=unclassified Bacillus cereus group TaxID=2750818 RepID=UPI00391EB8ED
MAIFPSNRSLTEIEINELCARIEREYNASNVNFAESTMAFHVFKGIVANEEITFNLDKQTGLIVTEEK